MFQVNCPDRIKNLTKMDQTKETFYFPAKKTTISTVNLILFRLNKDRGKAMIVKNIDISNLL